MTVYLHWLTRAGASSDCLAASKQMQAFSCSGGVNGGRPGGANFFFPTARIAAGPDKLGEMKKAATGCHEANQS